MTGDRPKLIVFAHACGPNAGSEPGAGWGMVMAMSEFADLIVLTGSARIADIRQWQAETRHSYPRFVEVPDRSFGRFLRWHRIPHFIHNQVWLRRARRQAKRIIATEPIDGTSHVTLSVYWLPTPAVSLGLPSIWGPVGGAVTTPRSLWSLLGWGGVLQELLDKYAILAAAALPSTRRAARLASVSLIQNTETLAALPSEAVDNARILNHALFNNVESRAFLPNGRYALWAARMESRKGGRLAIEALARADSSVRLIMVGDGPQRRSLEKLAERLGVAERIEFTGWVPRDRAIELMRGATTTIFTGVREEGGLALTEAMYTTRRLIVLDHGGAGTIARRATDPSRVALIAPGQVDEVADGFAVALNDHFSSPEPDTSPLLDTEAAMNDLEQAIRSAVSSDPASLESRNRSRRWRSRTPQK